MDHVSSNAENVFKGINSFLDGFEMETNKVMRKKFDIAFRIIKAEIQGVFTDYNAGILERFSGDYAKRVIDNANSGRNMPLFNTGDLFNSFESEVQDTLGAMVGSIYTDVEYATKLEKGDKKIVAYRYMEIALQRAMPKLERLFGG